MHSTIPELLRYIPCESLAPSYQESLAGNEGLLRKKQNPYPKESKHHFGFEQEKASMLAGIEKELKDPLKALRLKVAASVEELFQKNGQRSLVLGCMHYPNTANVDFNQTQTDADLLLPQQICRGREDHSHKNSVTIDLRVSPDERYELPLITERLLLFIDPMKEIAPHGPDFARRNFNAPAHTDDFMYVTNVDKIYLERIPAFERGPCSEGISNIPLIGKLHKLLKTGGVLAFDYMPTFCLFDSKGRAYYPPIPEFKPKPVSQNEIEEFVKQEHFRNLFAKLNNSLSPCADHPGGCPKTPCALLVSKVARGALEKKQKDEELVKFQNSRREGIRQKPKAVLKMSEVLLKVGKLLSPLELFEDMKAVPINEYPLSRIWIKASGDESEMESLHYQLSCYQSLNVDPTLADQIHPETKAVFERAVLALVNQVVFPQLKLLGFEKISFDPNGQNPENKRPFERVVYAGKI